jgi:glutathione S-transferase
MTCIEKGLDYELVPVPYGSEAHGAMHPFRRMPILEIDGRFIPETFAIVGHLDEAHPGARLQPEEQDARDRMRVWMAVCGDYIYRDVVRAIPRDRPPTEEQHSGARTALERAEGLVGEGPFLAGEALTLADLYLAPQLANCAEKAPGLLEGLPALGAFADLIGERESFLRTRPDATG